MLARMPEDSDASASDLRATAGGQPRAAQHLIEGRGHRWVVADSAQQRARAVLEAGHRLLARVQQQLQIEAALEIATSLTT